MKFLFNLPAVILCFLHNGVSGVEVVVSVQEGDSVTLHTGAETTQEEIIWYFNKSKIAEIARDQKKICIVYETVEDRLKLDHQTGSLTIMNITNTDSGVYDLLIRSSDTEMIFNVTVNGFSASERDEIKRMSAKEGDSVTLELAETKKPNEMTWYLHETVFANIKGNQSNICERFRDGLKLDNQTGSLTIMNTRTTDSGLYKLQMISRNGRFSITTVKRFCVTILCENPGLSSAAVGGIVAAVVLLVATAAVVVGVFYCRRKRHTPVPQNVLMFKGVGSDEVSVSVMEGDSVTLIYLGTNTQDDIKWFFNDTPIAEMTRNHTKISTDKWVEERMGNRLKVNEAGSLTIMMIAVTDSGLYQLQINSSREKIFNLSVCFSAAEQDEMKRKTLKVGESVTLDPGVINRNDTIQWHFNEVLIADITGDESKICADDECKKRFGDGLKLDNQTGSLTIMNTRTTHSGVYQLLIINNQFTIINSCGITVNDSGLSPGAIAGICIGTILLVVPTIASLVDLGLHQAVGAKFTAHVKK
ncbi:uncharacterized protein LOC122328152 [Puntigrus tetrazona]|uniref:uncharacterized protein LOC122328152 n=1 Tax=Puntigrus tetrazona TaxID=1606681 RepID=UPI001C8A4C8A|nr:uncharacterized protein LOC122328152 [Puntigrus tetrazona]